MDRLKSHAAFALGLAALAIPSWFAAKTVASFSDSLTIAVLAASGAYLGFEAVKGLWKVTHPRPDPD